MAPPLPPAPVGAALVSSLNNAKLVVEVFLDLDCPYSGKLFKTLWEGEGSVTNAYQGKPVQFVIQNVVQPWHPVSALLHEVSLAVKAISPLSFFPYINKIFDKQAMFTDEATYELSRKEVVETLIILAEEIGVPKEKLQERLALTGGNSGTQTTQAMKFAAKYHRVRGVHVTPTVFVNGLEASDISSSWTVGQWRELLDSCLEASY